MILDEILVHRREQLRREQEHLSMKEAMAAAKAAPAPRDFGAALWQPGLSVIAEVKKASPSKGVIAPHFHPVETAQAYQAAGAAAISVLTEERYFQGSNDYLAAIRREVELPLLRKDFVYDPYQLVHARALGADAALLIVAMLEPSRLQELLAAAKEYSLGVLVEVHDEDELETAIGAGAAIIGVNNRNLKTFQVSFAPSRRLLPRIPQGCVTVVESGVKGPEEMAAARELGAHAILVGETLMRSPDAGAALARLREAGR